MKEPVFHLTRKKYTEESTVITMRMPADMLRDIDAAAEASHRSRNEILSMALEFSLANLKVTEEEPAPPDAEKLLI